MSLHIKTIAFSSGLALIALLLSNASAQGDPLCAALSPVSDPEQNFKNIVGCLASQEASAHLGSGVFAINHKIKMPAGAKLFGSPGTAIKAVDGGAGFKDDSMLQLTGRNFVSNIAFVADGRLQPGCCTTVVAITGSGSKIDHVDISDEDASRRAAQTEQIRVAGLYFIGEPDSSENIASNLRIHALNFGVIFRKGLPASANNKVASSEIFDLSCDSFSFAGGGIAEGNRLHGTGFDCKQHPVPIPGGGFYALNNTEPVVIANNTITDICGVGFDIVGSANFKITGNKYRQRGAPLGGRYPYCNGFPAKFVDVSNFTVTDNLFSVIDAPPFGRSYKYFPEFKRTNAATYKLTPDSEKQIYAVRLLRQSKNVTGNRFSNNQMVAQCGDHVECTGGGIGLFIGPGVGTGGPNAFVGNTIIGTSVPAVRCGQDRWEANQLCRKSDSDGISCAATTETAQSTSRQTNDACVAH